MQDKTIEETLQQIQQEIQDLKGILAKVIGTTYESPANRFSSEAIDKAAKDFNKWTIERGDWVKDVDIEKYIKHAPWNAGNFIRKEFAFTNCFKRGSAYFYSKKDLLAFAKELSDRNIDLRRYKEFLDDKASFDRKQAKDGEKSKPYQVPRGLKNITTAEIPKPDPEKPRQDIQILKAEFKRSKLDQYIDVYKGTHAMLRHLYPYTKYLEPALLRQCRKWVEEFNTANEALQKITGKMEKFHVEKPDQIEL